MHSGVSGTSYTDSTAINGTTYFYVVTAVNFVGESLKSNEVSATPAVTAFTPVNLGPSFNLDGIVNDGSTFTLTTGVIDGGPPPSPPTCSGPARPGMAPPSPSAPPAPAMSSAPTGQTISLPAGQYASLQFPAPAVNGNQANQTFTVNYADGSDPDVHAAR